MRGAAFAGGAAARGFEDAEERKKVSFVFGWSGHAHKDDRHQRKSPNNSLSLIFGDDQMAKSYEQLQLTTLRILHARQQWPVQR